VFIGKNEKPSKDHHDITYSNVRSCYVAFDKMYELKYIHTCIFALTDLKMSVDYFFEIIPEKEEEKKKKTLEFVNNAHNFIEEQEIKPKIQIDLVKKNKFLIKKMMTIRNQESKYKSEFFSSKTNYNNEKNNIVELFSRVIKQKKNEHKKFEV